MSAQVLRCTIARRFLCSSCLQSRCTKAYYSQSALSSVAPHIQDPEASTSTSESTRGVTRSGPHHIVLNSSGPLDPTRLDRYLASISVTNLEPTLDDVERCKPAGFSRPDSPRYAVEYTNLLETLCRSFSKDQLRRFTELYKLNPIWSRSSRRKTEYAESIIEKAWGWPSLKEVERKRRDATEILMKSFIVTPSQLFLLMGKDGADLLQLSMQYNVHISLTSSPLSLRVEGLRGSLKGLSENISSLKKGIIDEIFELPTGRPIRSDLLQRISRLSGAYVENHGNRGKVRICAKDVTDIAAAKRLALHASLEVGTGTRTICYEPPTKMRDSPIEISEPQRYSVYPFVTPNSFPWMMHSGGAFRLRRLADWLGMGSHEDITSTSGLAGDSHRLLNLDGSWEDLRQLVCSTMPGGASNQQKMITASLGHVLLSSADQSQRSTIFPPLRNALSLPKMLEWIETSGTPLSFVPCVPPAVTTIAVDKRRVFHRLVYRTLPSDQASKISQHVLKFEIELPDFSPTHAVEVMRDHEDEERMLSSEPDSGADSHSCGNVSQPGGSTKASSNESSSDCQVGREIYINLMLPDRPVDVQLGVFDWDSITLGQQPQVLREYADKLHNSLINETQILQADPPLTFSFQGRAYYLRDNLRLRRGTNSVSVQTISSNCREMVEVHSESITDFQSDQKMQHCQLKIDGPIGELGWKRFLTACDQVSLVTLESRSKKENRDHFI